MDLFIRLQQDENESEGGRRKTKPRASERLGKHGVMTDREGEAFAARGPIPIPPAMAMD